MKVKLFISFLLFLATSSTFAQSKKAKDIEQLAHEWAASNNAHDIERLSKLYAPTVLFYGKSKDISSCINDKATFFKINDYKISISDIDIDFYKSGAIKCNFKKNESWKGVERNDQAYLLFEKRGREYLITGESDQRMDGKLGIDLRLGDKIYKKNNLLFIIIGFLAAALIVGAILFFRRRKKNEPEYKSSNEPQQHSQISEPPTFTEDMLKLDKGLTFEQFVVQKFDKRFFTLLNWRSDKFIDGHFPLSNMDPDVEFMYKDSYKQVDFAVECKWRSIYFNEGVEVAKASQLQNYRNYQNRSGYPVFIVLGVAGSPSNPADIYVIPLHEIHGNFLTKNQLAKYYRHKKGNFFLEIPGMRLQ